MGTVKLWDNIIYDGTVNTIHSLYVYIQDTEWCNMGTIKLWDNIIFDDTVNIFQNL